VVLPLAAVALPAAVLPLAAVVPPVVAVALPLALAALLATSCCSSEAIVFSTDVWLPAEPRPSRPDKSPESDPVLPVPSRMPAFVSWSLVCRAWVRLPNVAALAVGDPLWAIWLMASMRLWAEGDPLVDPALSSASRAALALYVLPSEVMPLAGVPVAVVPVPAAAPDAARAWAAGEMLAVAASVVSAPAAVAAGIVDAAAVVEGSVCATAGSAVVALIAGVLIICLTKLLLGMRYPCDISPTPTIGRIGRIWRGAASNNRHHPWVAVRLCC